MRETTIEKHLITEIKKRGAKAWKFVSPGLRGVPDRIVLLPGGQTIFVELKAPGKEREPLQVKRASELQDLGFKVYCLGSIELVDWFIWEEFGK